MVRTIFCTMLCFVLLGLVACASQQLVVKRINDRGLCKNVCQERLNSCNHECHNNCQECTQGSNCSTARDYNKYKHEQCVQGGIIARELNSYRDPLQCRKTTCDCYADYNVCIQSCNGLIHKRLQAAPVC